MRKNNIQNQKGFTLVESLVAVSILVLVIVATTGAVQMGISSYIFSKDQVVAFYLAQEGIENIRNLRDTNGLYGRDWLTGIAANSSDPCYFGRACIVDALANTLISCSGGSGSCPVLRQDSVTKFYGHNSAWQPSIYTREIILTRVNDDEISMLVTVKWSKGPVQREFRARENILNWQ